MLNNRFLLNILVSSRLVHLNSNKFIHKSSILLANVDYYKILGVPRNASAKEIRKSYIELAKKYHPDANPGNADAQKRFQEIAVAYTVLSSKEERNKYDAQYQQQEQSFESFRRSSNQYQSPYETFHSSVNPEELFRKIFGTDFQESFTKADREWVDYSGTHHGHAPTEATIIKLSFREAAKGCEKLIEAHTLTVCEKCMGIGSEPGKSIQVCPFCDGLGFEIVEGIEDRFRVTCRFCKGKGHNVVNKCTNCLGYGRTLVERKIVIPVPPGVSDGETFKINVDPSEGDEARGTQGSQEIYIKFVVESSEYFSVDGNDLHSSASISIPQAIYGGQIIIDGLWSTEKIAIDPGSDSHTVIKLKNKGLKDRINSSYGDHYVHLKINVPKKLTDEEDRLLKKYAAIETLTNGTINGIEKIINDHDSSKNDAEKQQNATDPDISHEERERDRHQNIRPTFSIGYLYDGFIGNSLKKFLHSSKIILRELLSRK